MPHNTGYGNSDDYSKGNKNNMPKRKQRQDTHNEKYKKQDKKSNSDYYRPMDSY